MKIGEHLFFAPNVRFADLDVDDPIIVQHFHSRIDGYYLAPARLLAKHHAFAAVLLLASSIDAIARYASQPGECNRCRYVRWLHTALPCLSSKLLATRFYEDFRCGLVHEARAKDGCVFTSQIRHPVVVENGVMAVNPELFADEVFQALDTFCKCLKVSAGALAEFQKALKRDFKKEMSG
jgi:hypothetical protein